MAPSGQETSREAVLREVEEELGIRLGCPLEPLGCFSALAANEPDTIVLADVFWCRCDEVLSVRAEIEELRWIDPAPPGEIQLAPLTRGCIIPALPGRRLSC